MKVAIIENGVVTKVVILNSVPNNGVDVTNQRVGIGYTYDGETFSPPEAVEQPKPKLSKLAFRNRFTLIEKQAIYTAAETDLIIRIFLDDLTSAEYIDLEDTSTVDGVNYLETEGHIDVGRAAEILS